MIQIPTSPLLQGAITNATASMLASAGDSLAKQIEEQNVKADAQLKAPAIGKLYADSLTRVAQGDFTGFQGLTQAQAMSTGNPFLQSMFKDMDNLGVRLADSRMDREAATARLTASEAAQTARFKNADEMQNTRINAQNARDDARMDQHRQDQLDMEFRQKADDVRAENARIETEWRKQAYEIQKKNEAEAKLGQDDPEYKPTIVPLPPKPEPKPEPQRMQLPQRKGNVSPLGPVSDPLVADLPNPDGGLGVDPMQQTGPVPSVGASPIGPAKIQVPSGEMVGNVPLQNFGEDAQVPAQQQQVETSPKFANRKRDAIYSAIYSPEVIQKTAKEASIVNEKPPVKGVAERQVGNIRFEIPGYKEGEGKSKITTEYDTHGGKVTKTSDIKPSPAMEMGESLSTIQGGDPAFALFVARHTLSRNQVRIKPVLDDKGKPTQMYIPMAVSKNGHESQMQEYDDKGQETGVVHQVDKEVADALKKFESLVNGTMKGKFSMYVPLGSPEAKKLREDTITEIIDGGNLEEANNQLRLFRVEPITKSEVEKARPGIEARRKQEEFLKKTKAEQEAQNNRSLIELNSSIPYFEGNL